MDQRFWVATFAGTEEHPSGVVLFENLTRHQRGRLMFLTERSHGSGYVWGWMPIEDDGRSVGSRHVAAWRRQAEPATR